MIMEISIVQCIRTYFVYSLFFLVDFEAGNTWYRSSCQFIYKKKKVNPFKIIRNRKNVLPSILIVTAR